MISLVENEEQKQRLLHLCEKTAFGCKIASVVSGYGFDKGFACFWLDTEADVVFCQSDDVMLLSGTVLNVEETAGFLHAIGPRSVFCAVRNAEALSLPVSGTGDVLKKQLPEGVPQLPSSGETDIRELYGLLEEIGMVKEFEPFYLDLSHKLRHGNALAFTCRHEGQLAGCALVSAIEKNSVILSALAVRPELRRQGIGTDLVKEVERAFPGKTLYVFREKEKNQEFYKRLGYSKTDTWVSSER